MATVARKTVAPLPGSWMVFPGVGWDGLRHMKALLGERRMRITYAGGDLMVMSPGWPHETYAQALEEIIKAVGRAFQIRTWSLRSTYWERREADAAKSPDASFYVAGVAKLAGRYPDPKVDPAPDLVIEVEITNPIGLSLEAYARLGVGEVWHLARRPRRASSLRFLKLEGGVWTPVATSPSFPMLEATEILSLVDRAVGLDDIDRADFLEAWIRDELRPGRRRRPRRGD